MEAQVLVLGDLDVGSKVKSNKKWARVIDVRRREGEDDDGFLENTYFETILECHDLMYTLTKDLGMPRPTRVQAAALPWAVDGRDVVICSHTGTGKTMVSRGQKSWGTRMHAQNHVTKLLCGPHTSLSSIQLWLMKVER